VLLVSNAADHIFDKFDKMPYAFSEFTSIRFLDVNGSGVEKLMIGADFSFLGPAVGVDSAVFDLADHRLTPLFSTNTVVLDEADLDIRRCCG
jgi:hypothetical protein